MKNTIFINFFRKNGNWHIFGTFLARAQGCFVRCFLDIFGRFWAIFGHFCGLKKSILAPRAKLPLLFTITLKKKNNKINIILEKVATNVSGCFIRIFFTNNTIYFRFSKIRDRYNVFYGEKR